MAKGLNARVRPKAGFGRDLGLGAGAVKARRRVTWVG